MDYGTRKGGTIVHFELVFVLMFVYHEPTFESEFETNTQRLPLYLDFF